MAARHRTVAKIREPEEYVGLGIVISLTGSDPSRT